MDPVSLTLGVVGLGMSIFGAFGAADDAKHASEISKDEAKQQQGINDAKQQQMEIEGRRTQLENVRNNQRASAMALSAGVNQGANKGSGLQGGLAQINDQSLFNMQGVNDALSIGRQINGFNQNITKDKYAMADVQSSSATNQGISSLGGAVMKAGPIVGQISQGFGSNNLGSGLMGGGSPSGYGRGSR